MTTRAYISMAALTAVLTFGGLTWFTRAPTTLGATTAKASPVAAVSAPLARATLPVRAPARLPALSAVRDGRFYPDRVRPYFRDRLTKPVQQALLQGRYRRALKAADNALAQQAPHPERLEFVLAWLLHEQRRYAEAAPLFTGLRARYATLAQPATYYAARCFYHLGLQSRALALIVQVRGAGAVAHRALLLHGDILRALARFREAEQRYLSFLRRHRGRHGTAEARVRLAESVARRWATAPASRRRTAGRHLRQVLKDAPGTFWARKAQALMARHRGRFPRTRAGRTRASCDQQLRQLAALARRRRLADALARYRRGRWDRRRGCSQRQQCVGLATLGRRLARKKRYRSSASGVLRRAHRACQRAKLTDLVVKTAYSLAKVQTALGKPAAAERLFRQVELRYPRHSYADDARYRRAGLLRRRGRTTAADKLLASLPNRFPKGDRQHDALWRLAWDAYGRRDLKRARALLLRSTRIKADPPQVEAAGRDGYWLGRVLERLGTPAAAHRAWVRVAKRHPLTWYALLSLNRLQRAAPETARRVLLAWRPGPRRAALAFGPDPTYRSPVFARAVEYARLGLGRLAATELHALGIFSPVKVLGEPPAPGAVSAAAARKRKLTAARKTRLWAAAVLYDRAGLFHKSHWMVRHALRGYARKAPRGTNRARWRISFPTGYGHLVEPHARKHGLPPTLVWGLMREESAFNPRLVSHANAVGLMQLLQQTARRFRGRDRRAITASVLKRPARNVPIGTRYLGWLLRLFHGQYVPAVAAYNAGETKVFSWIQARGSLPTDHFVEAIPFRETRRYVKRVLGSAFAYAVLADAPRPVLTISAVLPPKLVVKSRTWQKMARRWVRSRRRAKRKARLRKARLRKTRKRKTRNRRRRKSSRTRR